MSWAGSRAGDLYVGTRRVAWCGRGGQRWWTAVDGLPAALAALGEHLAAAGRGQALRLWWSGALCRAFLLQRPAGLAGAEELRRVAAAVAAPSTGLAGPLRLWIDERSGGAACVVAAVAEDTFQQCQRTLAAAGCRVVAAGPWWAAALRAALEGPGTDLVGVHDCDALTVLAGGGDRFESAASYAPLANPAVAEATWLRAQALAPNAPARPLRLRLDVGAALQPSPLAGLALGCWAERLP